MYPHQHQITQGALKVKVKVKGRHAGASASVVCCGCYGLKLIGFLKLKLKDLHYPHCVLLDLGC
jgi:hypothetical protein